MKFDSKVALALVFGVFSAVSIYRAIHFSVTGFFVPDEFAYIYYRLGDFDYQGRQFFNLVTYLFARVFGMDTPDKVVILMPLYFSIWFSVGIGSAYKTMKLMGYRDKTIRSTLLLSLTIPVFLLFSVTILTEPVAFAMTMLGIYFTVWFWKKGVAPAKYAAPFLAALCFVAAAYTRVDFIVFQALGFLPFVIAESRKTRSFPHAGVVLALFLIPAATFMFLPTNSAVSTVAAIQSVVDTTHQVASTKTQTISSTNAITTTTTGVVTTTINGTMTTVTVARTITTTTIGTTLTVVSEPPPSGNLPLNAGRFLLIGFVVGFNPVITVLVALSFFATFYGIFKRDDDAILTFVLGFLGLAVFAAVVFIFSVVPYIPTSTIIRYAYDALPAFFLFVPYLLNKVKGNKPYAVMVICLVAFAGVGVISYQPLLQTNLGFSYPFLSGEQSFLTLDYRAPYAQIRDYLHSQPPQSFMVLAEDPLSLDANVTNDWRFTPGVSDIDVTFFPYSYGTNHSGTFYLYLPPGIKANLTLQSWRVVYDTPSFYFAEVTV